MVITLESSTDSYTRQNTETTYYTFRYPTRGGRMLIRAFVALVLLANLPVHVSAQAKTELDKLDEKFSQYFERVMPGWKHERVEPVMKTENVLIQFWSFSNRKVKIAVIPHKSADEAREVLQRHAKYQFNKQELSDLGDEAYAGGYGSADVAFRK